MLMLAVAAGATVVGIVALVRPSLLVEVPRHLVVVAAVLGAAALASADTAPTGWEGFDLVLRACFGASVPLAARRAGTAATGWLVIVATALLAVVDAPVPAVTAIAAGGFIALAVAGLSHPAACALAAAAAIGPLAHAEWPLASGASAAAMAIAAGPVLVVALGRTTRSRRARVAALSGVVAVVVAVGAVVGLASAYQAKGDVDRAVDLATDGLDLLGDDDESARTRMLESAERFDAAEETLRAWWARPALLVPGVAQQSRAVSTMASAGADLARTAAAASIDADVDAVRPRGGRVDLDALDALAAPLERSITSLRRSSTRLEAVHSPFLLAPVAARLSELRAEVDDALESAELASHAVEVVPGVLGADGPRRYFIAIQTPSELRGNGGFMGNWAELVTDDGRFELTRSGRVRELSRGGDDPQNRRIETEPEFVARYGQAPARAWGLIALSPDHPTVSRVIAELYPKSGGQPIDGVIAVTPAAFAAFLELSGPIEVPGYPERLDSGNAERILLHQQYLEFPRERSEEREGFLSAAVEVLFDVLTEGDLPGPSVLAEELGPAVEARNLQLWSAHPEEQDLFARLGATGSVSRHDVDSFGVVTQNYNGNKIDWFLRRSIRYQVEWDPHTGSVEGTVTARIENHAPDRGLPPSIIGWGGDVSAGHVPVADGENLMLVTVYSAFTIHEVTVDGESQEFSTGRELGHETARFYLSVPPGGTREVIAEVAGDAAFDGGYVIRPVRQPTVEPDSLEIELSLARGWAVEAVSGGQRRDRSTAGVRSTADHRIRLGVEVAPTGRTGVLDRLRGRAAP